MNIMNKIILNENNCTILNQKLFGFQINWIVAIIKLIIDIINGGK
jgi:hypothetical protein